MSETKGPQINWLGATGSALGSVSSAVLLSTLGAAGTLVGAAIGSLVITVGGSVYAHYIGRAKSGIEKTADKVKLQRGTARKKDKTDTTPITAQKDATNIARSEPLPEDEPAKKKPSWRQILRGIRWKRVGWMAAGLFAVTTVLILAFELTTGRPVSSYTGGTSPSSTGNSLTGVTDPSGESPGWSPEQDVDEDFDEPPQGPPPEVDEPAPPEEEAPGPPEPEPEPEPQPQPEEEAPQQDEPAELPQE